MYEIEVNKDGTMVEKYSKSPTSTNNNANPVTYDGTGKWYWLDNNKNKTGFIGGNLSGSVTRLTNKELVIENESSYKDVNGTTTSENKVTLKYVFEKQK